MKYGTIIYFVKTDIYCGAVESCQYDSVSARGLGVVFLLQYCMGKAMSYG